MVNSTPLQQKVSRRTLVVLPAIRLLINNTNFGRTITRSAQKRKASSLILKPMKSVCVHNRYYISLKGAL